MKLQELFEATDVTSADSDRVTSMKDEINRCAKIIFDREAGPVKDLKRSKEAIFFGVSHHKSRLTDSNDKPLFLTFDNSTDSTEFELNSLVPLMIEKGSDQDKKILSLYRKFEIKSKKKTNYINHGDQTVLREIHLGTDITKDTVKMVKALMKVLANLPDDEAEEEEPEEKKPDPKEKKSKSKE